jgi:histidine triad (HIT) family protein
MENCLFCKIAKKEIPSKLVFEDEILMAFHDITPQAPIHILVIPKVHRESLLALRGGEDDRLMVHLLEAVKRIAGEKGMNSAGFRLVANTGRNGGQTVSHLHFHLLGGRQMTWPPG